LLACLLACLTNLIDRHCAALLCSGFIYTGFLGRQKKDKKRKRGDIDKIEGRGVGAG
jgi:hypothetical protein